VVNLGNIKPTFIKKIAVEMINKYSDEFKKDDFQHNKEKVAEISNVTSVLLRNRIAGYITHYLKSKS